MDCAFSFNDDDQVRYIGLRGEVYECRFFFPAHIVAFVKEIENTSALVWSLRKAHVGTNQAQTRDDATIKLAGLLDRTREVFEPAMSFLNVVQETRLIPPA